MRKRLEDETIASLNKWEKIFQKKNQSEQAKSAQTLKILLEENHTLTNEMGLMVTPFFRKFISNYKKRKLSLEIEIANIRSSFSKKHIKIIEEELRSQSKNGLLYSEAISFYESLKKDLKKSEIDSEGLDFEFVGEFFSFSNNLESRTERVSNFCKQISNFDKTWDTRKLITRNLRKIPQKFYTDKIFFVGESGHGISSNITFETKSGQQTNLNSPWMAYYEGFFSVPENGVYRFVGNGDDALLVGVNSKTVFYAFYPGYGYGLAIKTRSEWEPSNFCELDGKNLVMRGLTKTLYKGSRMFLKAGVKYKVQIIFGEATADPSFSGSSGACLGLQHIGHDTDENFPMFILNPFGLPHQKSFHSYRTQTGPYNCSKSFMPVGPLDTRSVLKGNSPFKF